jgi:hypothetical protein
VLLHERSWLRDLRPNNTVFTDICPLTLCLVDHALYRLFHLANGLVLSSLVLKPFIICHCTDCFLRSAFDLVGVPRQHKLDRMA